MTFASSEKTTTAPGDTVVIVGGGHAGSEAAHAAAAMGLRTVLVTLSRAALGRMSCNPSIGGLAKGQLVREVDALGGIMGILADRTALQFRILNASKGPAVQSPRCQSDNVAYNAAMVDHLAAMPYLEIVEDEVVGLHLSGNAVAGVETARHGKIDAKAVILTTGTFLGGVMHTGEEKKAGGRVGEGAAYLLSDVLKRFEFRMGRLKTGTPPRLRLESIDLSSLEIQEGDATPVGFSFARQPMIEKQVPCWITRTSTATHEIIAQNLDRSPMYTGRITGRGPRYCPSIEDKIFRFADKDSHQIFLERESLSNSIVYPNGISTSLPADVQERFVRTIKGLESAEIIRFGYAVEYDYVDPTELFPSLMTKKIAGLFHAGQLNGTTGYEEAAAQGLMAGTNAALWVKGEEPLILGRDEAYIGVLIDDLVTRGVQEPYRMFTSLAEHRLLLRHDNADLRLERHGKRIGLLPPSRSERVGEKRRLLDEGRSLLASRREKGARVDELLKRPERSLSDFEPTVPEIFREPYDVEIRRLIEVETKYSGYVDRQESFNERMRRAEDTRIPDDFDFSAVPQLRFEAREKFTRIRPRTLGQASRISGISQPDLALVLVHLTRTTRNWSTRRAETDDPK